jgi:outer membrane immunogenic protein
MPKCLLPALIAIAVSISSDSIHAADLGRPSRAAPAVPPAVHAVYDWSGFYVGAQGGYGAGDSSGTQNAGGTFFPVVPYSIEPQGILGGGHVGFNYQAGRWVVGIEGDIEAADVNAMSIVTTGGQDYFFNAKADMLASIRGRAGLAIDTWLVYATGGIAWGNISTPPLAALDGTRTGWTAGAGVQYAFRPNWSARLEYRYTDLGRVSAPAGELTSFDDNSFNFHALRAGITYKFGWLK